MKKKKFLRTSWKEKIRLGRRNKKKQKWRKARGRHNKIRESKKSHLRRVEPGFRTAKKSRGKILGKERIVIRNLKDAEKIEKGKIALIMKVGRKLRARIEEKIKEQGGNVLNKKKIIERK